jgi:hypothetical protein
VYRINVSNKLVFNIIRYLALSILFIVPFAITPVANAAGSSSFTITPNSGNYAVGSTLSITVNEDSGLVGVNAVQLNLSYNSNLLFNSISSSTTPFTLCGSSSGGGGNVSIACAAKNVSVTNTQLVAVINFTVQTSGGIAIGVVNGPINNTTQIVSSSQTNVWNGVLTSFIGTSGSSGGGTPTVTSVPYVTPTVNNTAPIAPSTSAAPVTSSTSSSLTNTTKTPSTTTDQGSNASPDSLAASPNSLTIDVVDSRGRPIDKAKVTITPGNIVAFTNSGGLAIFKYVGIGSHTVAISSPGKKTITKPLVLSPGQERQVSYNLVNNNNSLRTALTVLIVTILALGFAFRLLIFRKFKTHFQHSLVYDPIISSDVVSTPIISSIINQNDLVIKSKQIDLVTEPMIISPNNQAEVVLSEASKPTPGSTINPSPILSDGHTKPQKAGNIIMPNSGNND